MSRHRLSQAILLLVLMIVSTVSVMASTNIATCQTLNTPGETYLLTQSVSSPAVDCMTIDANGITLDCQGYQIEYDTLGLGGNAVELTGNRNDVTIKNCLFNSPDTIGAGGGAINADGQIGLRVLNNDFQITAGGANSEWMTLNGYANHTLIDNNTVVIDVNGFNGALGFADQPINITFSNNDIRYFGNGGGSTVLFEFYDGTYAPDDLTFRNNRWSYTQALFFIYAVTNMIIENDYIECFSASSQCENQFFENGVPVNDAVLMFTNMTINISATASGSDWIYVENAGATGVTVLLEDVTIYNQCTGDDCSGTGIVLNAIETVIMDNVQLIGDTAGFSIGGQGDGSSLNIENSHFDSSGSGAFLIYDYASYAITDTRVDGTIRIEDSVGYTSLNKTFLNSTFDVFDFNGNSFEVQVEEWTRGRTITTLFNAVDDATVSVVDALGALQWTDTVDAQGYTSWNPTPRYDFDDVGNTTQYNPYTANSTSIEFGFLSLSGQTVGDSYQFLFTYSEATPPPITGNFANNLQTCDDTDYNTYLNFMVIFTILFMVTLPYVKKNPQMLSSAFTIFIVLMVSAGLLMVVSGC